MAPRAAKHADDAGHRGMHVSQRHQRTASMEAHLEQLETQGYTVVPAAIPAEQLRPIQAAFDRVCKAVRATKPPEYWSVEARSIQGAIDFFRAYEIDRAFECLMDHPSVFPILAAALRHGRGGPPGEPRLRDPVAQFMPGHTQGAGWHRDGGNIRLTYTLDDLDAGGGGTACVAGSHLDRLYGRTDMLPLPAWFKANRLGAVEDAPVDPARPIVIPLAGAPAGSCMINWTAIIHRRTDNRSDSPRRTFWQVFCRDGFNLGDRLCGHLSSEYRAAQTVPGRIALMDDATQRSAGEGYWRLEDIEEGHQTWPSGGTDHFPFERTAGQGTGGVIGLSFCAVRRQIGGIRINHVCAYTTIQTERERDNVFPFLALLLFSNPR